MKIVRPGGGTWEHTYNTGSSAIYILEEWLFRLNGDVLQLIIDGDDENALNVAFGLTDFQVTARMQDDTTLDSLGAADNWTSLKSLEVTLAGEDSFAGETIEASLTSEFFPRNILSN